MKELEKQIAELKTQIKFCKSNFSRLANTYQENTMLDQLENSLKIIESLQAENQQLREKLEIAKNALEIISTQEYYYSLSLSKEVSEESIVKAMSKYAREKLNQLNTKETKGESNDR